MDRARVITLSVNTNAPVSVRNYMRRAYPAAYASVLNRLFDRRDIKVNGVRASGTHMLKSGDCLQIYIAESLLFGALPEVLFEDENIIVLDKPAGLSAVGDCVSRDTLEERLRVNRECDTFLCHRLDHNTSGVIVAAKNKEAHEEILSAFANGRVTKRYLALIKGVPNPPEATISAYCVKNADTATMTILKNQARHSLPIVTRYRVIQAEYRPGICLAEISPLTGRTHQIRAHMASIGYPVIGDDKYGDRALNRALGARRQALRSMSIEFAFVDGPLLYLDGHEFKVKEIEWGI